MKILSKYNGFDWDAGNMHKNVIKHNVSIAESEEVFFNDPVIVLDDSKHSGNYEVRYWVLGKTDIGRRLMIVFTERGELIRIISARDMSKREREFYEKY